MQASVASHLAAQVVLGASCIAVIGCQPSAQPREQLVADSIRDFSGKQGAKNWQYGYWDRTTDSDDEYGQDTDFKLLQHFGTDTLNGLSSHQQFRTGELWYLEDGRYYTSLWADGGHANSATMLGKYAPAEQWVVRRWVSSTATTLKIHGQVGKVMPWGKNWGGNCHAQIVVDGETVFSSPIDNDGRDYSVTVEVRKRSNVDFLIGPGPSVGVTQFTAKLISIPATR